VANILGLCDLLKNYKNETEEMKNKCIDYMIEATKELDEIIHKIVHQANESKYLDNE
jgi:F0F1-type ATP synthase membrane subunit b/b'